MKVAVVNNGGENKVRSPKQKERHIVSWSQEEDDILREQIRVHGTENWTIIASKFKDKTTRQCRRRWFTYLNSDFKKGGWSPEEDMLLCEAQKIFGNRWTEIAKVVSGRTDNAVKNRFTTLCKKRAKCESLVQENSKSSSYVNLNNKRVIFCNGLNADEGSESTAALKRTRTTHTSNIAEELLGHSFHVLAQSLHGRIVNLPTDEKDNTIKEAPPTSESVNNESERTFLKKDDPKVVALMQQAELLSSLAVKVNTENTDQSLENAWMVLQDYLKQSEETGLPRFGNSDAGFRLEKLKEIVGGSRNSNEGSRLSWRDCDACDSSPASSEYSTGSTLLSNGQCEKTDKSEAEACEHDIQSNHLEDDQHFLAEENGICRLPCGNEDKNMVSCDDVKGDNRALSVDTNMEFSSPVHVTPFFGAFAAAVPSPKFSESEKHFLMKTLGIESASPANALTSPARPPACKRSLLHCL